MRFWAVLFLSLSALVSAGAQSQPSSYNDLHAKPMYSRGAPFPLSVSASYATRSAQIASRGLPLWSSSFTRDRITYNYTMVGGTPSQPATTNISTVIIPINFAFDGWRNSSGKLITLNGSSVVSRAMLSPIYVPAAFPDGTAQYGDAVQRASFWNVSSPQWHTVMSAPRQLPAMTFTVPKKDAQLFKMPNGTLAGMVSSDFLNSVLTKILNTVSLRPDELPILLVHNVLMYEGTTNNCCILGFHTAFSTGAGVQTLVYATWIDPSVGVNVFADSTLADIDPLSHEVAEWMADPLLNNIVPTWRMPGASVGQQCSKVLEVGDPIEAVRPTGYSITVSGMKYHPQNVALFSWFQRLSTSSAFDHAYSFPNLALLTTHADACK